VGNWPKVYADELLWPWTERLLRDLPDVSPFDVHTHLGANDPSGFSATVTELVAALATVHSRAAVFPLAEPEGYSGANDRVLAAAADHDELVAFCRIRLGGARDRAVRPVRRARSGGVGGGDGRRVAQAARSGRPVARERTSRRSGAAGSAAGAGVRLSGGGGGIGQAG
jgi:hypothetical protein